MTAKYIDATEYTKALAAGLESFEKALTHRWRVEAAEAIRNAVDIPLPGIMECTPNPPAVSWDYRAPEARAHINGDHCGFLAWVDGGQQGELSEVSCAGARGGISSDIGCGVGGILSQVYYWAWDERVLVGDAVPRLEGHELAKLEQAYDTFIRIGGKLGLEDGGDKAILPSAKDRALGIDVNWLTNNDERRGWYRSWTGLAADTVKGGFLASTTHTMRNQSALLGWLANLYSERASMIAVGRNNVLHWLKWATKAMSEKHKVSIDYTDQWKAINTVATTVGTASIIPGVGAVAGPFAAVVGLVGFVGQAVDDGSVRTEDAHRMQDVVVRLGSELRTVGEKLDKSEHEYDLLAAQLNRELAGLHSDHLELYNLTGNKAGGTGSRQGYTAEVDVILSVAERCYSLSEAHAALLSDFATTAPADMHLSGRDMQPTDGDTVLVEIRDALESFLKTTGARYLLASDQIAAAAKEYAKRDANTEVAFNDRMKDWGKHGIGVHDVDLDPHQPGVQSDPRGHAGSTDRSEIAEALAPR